MDDVVDVIKLNSRREETWRYRATVLQRPPGAVLIEARFNRDDMPFHGIIFGRGDRFVELYYSERWYNIFEIHDRMDDHLKGWYCNVSRPAEVTVGTISYVDLALDLLVFPDGHALVLDEDEFAALELPMDEESQALDALAELKALFQLPVRIDLSAMRLP